jgi:predicted MFS family arabinose efflux permease
MRDRTDWNGVAFGITLACLIAFQQFKLPPVLPGLIATYDWDRTLAGGFMAVYGLAGLVLSVPIGRAMQHRGMFGLLLGSLLLFILGNLVSLALPALGGVVLLGRTLEGIAFAVGAVAGPAFASRSAARRDLGLVVGLMATWIPVGQLVATGLALLFSRWQDLWLAAIGATLLLGLWALALRRHETFAAQGAMGQGGTAIGQRQRWALIATAAIFLLWSMQYFAYMTWLPQYLVEVTRLGNTAATAAYALPVAVLLGFNILTGVLLGAGVPLAMLLLGALGAQALVWWLIPVTHGVEAGAALLVLYGVGAGITPTCLFALPAAIMGRAAGPAAFGIIMAGRNLGVLAGPVLLAAVTQPPAGWTFAWPLFGSTTLLALLVALGLTLRAQIDGHPTSRT